MARSFDSDFLKTINLIVTMSDAPKTIPELMDEMNATERTVYRNLTYLRNKGVRVEKSKGTQVPTYQIKSIESTLKDSIQNLYDKIHRLNA